MYPDVPDRSPGPPDNECGKLCSACHADCESRVYDFGEATRNMIDSVFFKLFPGVRVYGRPTGYTEDEE